MVNRANGTRANGHRANGNRADVVAPQIFVPQKTLSNQIDLSTSLWILFQKRWRKLLELFKTTIVTLLCRFSNCKMAVYSPK